MRGIIIGTGPSLTPEAIEKVNASKLPKFGCNLAFDAVPDLVALFGCNYQFWDYYWPQLQEKQYDLWTSHPQAHMRKPLRYIRGEWRDGLSTDPNVVHYGHSSGYQLINLALHYGITEFILIGYDMRYPAGYDGHRQVAGGDRHFFGEYPKELQHWTRYGIGPAGEIEGLLACYRTISPDDYGIRIVNCSPGSALDFFEMGGLREYV